MVLTPVKRSARLRRVSIGGNNGDGNGLPSSPASSAASAPVMRGGAAGGGYYY